MIPVYLLLTFFPTILEVNMSPILCPTGQKLGMAHILLPLGYCLGYVLIEAMNSATTTPRLVLPFP